MARFEIVSLHSGEAPTPRQIPKTGDTVTVVVHAKVSAVQPPNEYTPQTIVYFEEVDGQYVSPVYLGPAVVSMAIVPPPLDLDALPIGTVVEAIEEHGSKRLYIKIEGGFWRGLSGSVYSSRVIVEDSVEIHELVRKEG